MNIHQRLQRNFIGGLISGIGSLFGAAINADSQERQNEKNLIAQREENQKNRDWEEHMYNTYESPAAQRQQMLEAGLNPMGAITPQSVGSASTASLPAGQAPQWGSALQEAIPAFYDASLAAQELRNKRLEATSQELENWAKAFENGNAEEMYQAQLESIEAGTALTREQKRKQREEIRALKFTYKKAKEAYDEGANEFKDAHRAADDAHAAHESSEKRLKETHELSLKYLNGELSAQELSNRILKDHADYSASAYSIKQLFHVNVEDIPVWLRPIAFEIENYHRKLSELQGDANSFDAADWEVYNEFIAELHALENDFKNSLKSDYDVIKHDSSYANRKAEDTKSANAVQQATWDREASQRELENYYRKLTAISTILGNL